MIILECINKHPIVYISVQEWGANKVRERDADSGQSGKS